MDSSAIISTVVVPMVWPIILPIASLLGCLLIFGYFRNAILKYRHTVYLICFCFSLCVLGITYSPYREDIFLHLVLWIPYILFKRALLGTSLLIIIMYLRVMPEQSKFVRWYAPLRGAMSVIAAICVMPHVVIYGGMYLVPLILGTANLRFAQALSTLIATVALFVLFPLLMNSTHRAREHMNPKTLTQICRLAYTFYVLIILHILVLYMAALMVTSVSAAPRFAVYFTGFVYYAALLLGFCYLHIRKITQPAGALLPADIQQYPDQK